MKVSVLVPVYNVEKYLSDSIESVVGQTHTNTELILVNDGSTDGSPDICVQYALRYPDKIKVINTKNSGPLHARVTAMEEASGDIFVFLDADDCLRKDALEQIVHCFKTKACDMVLFNAGDCEQFPTRRIIHTLGGTTFFDEASKKIVYRGIILGQIPNSVCLKAVRAECVEISEHFFCINAKHGEDLLLSAYFITNSEKIVYINEGLYHYRNRPGSAVDSFDLERKESIKTVHTELEKYIDKWNMPELKPLHNARKVKGWVYNLDLLMKSRRSMSKKDYREELLSMSKDSYFRLAYTSMDNTVLSLPCRLLARWLYKQNFFFIAMTATIKSIKEIFH